MYGTVYESAVGPLTIEVNGRGALLSIHFGRRPVLEERDRCAAVIGQLDEYFRGQRREFDLELLAKGTPFQCRVWSELTRIPYGATISYRELAGRIGRPSAVRAVGAANGANPIPIIIPCHRVIGADGTLTGYGGGLPLKQALLSLERKEPS